MTRERHKDLTLAAVAAELPWREELRRFASAQALALAIKNLAFRARQWAEPLDPEGAGALAALISAQEASGSLVHELDNVEAVAAAASDPVANALPLLNAVAPQARGLAEIAAAARVLEELISDFRGRFSIAPPQGREDHLRRAFIVLAADVWETLTGDWPKASRKGPFVRFCAMAWIENDMPDLGEDPSEPIGASIERFLKVPQKSNA